jgi:hypothetical protein
MRSSSSVGPRLQAAAQRHTSSAIKDIPAIRRHLARVRAREHTVDLPMLFSCRLTRLLLKAILGEPDSLAAQAASFFQMRGDNNIGVASRIINLAVEHLAMLIIGLTFYLHLGSIFGELVKFGSQGRHNASVDIFFIFLDFFMSSI